MSKHLDNEQLDRYRRCVVSGAELLAVDDHLSTCIQCRTRFMASTRLPEGLIADPVGCEESPSHLTYQQLAAYVDERLASDDRDTADEHVRDCGVCRTELQDLQQLVEPPPRTQRHNWSRLSSPSQGPQQPSELVGPVMGTMPSRTTGGAPPNSSAPGETLYLLHYADIERIVESISARRRLSTPDADDFSTYVAQTLSRNGYDILTRFQGRSSVSTFLTTVIQRLFLDYRQGAWGRWRPSAEAKRAGAVAIRLEQLVARDGFAIDEACEILLKNSQVPMERRELERLAHLLPVRRTQHLEHEAALSATASPMADTEDYPEQGASHASERLPSAIQRRINSFDIEDRVILMMRFVDGLTIQQIATVLRLDKKSVYRRMDHQLKTLRAGLEAEGFVEQDATPATLAKMVLAAISETKG